MWQTIFPKWPIDQERMQRLLYGVPGQHYIHEEGFCLSSLGDGAHGKIVAVGVLPEHRGKGLGIALVEAARAGLVRAASDNGGQLSSIEVGSLTPRFWPQLPVDFPPEVADFFLHRGILSTPRSQISRFRRTQDPQAFASPRSQPSGTSSETSAAPSRLPTSWRGSQRRTSSFPRGLRSCTKNAWPSSGPFSFVPRP